MLKRITTGVVSNVEDPAFAGRIKVTLAEFGGEESPTWIAPVHPSSVFDVPLIDQEVEIELPADEDDLTEFPDEIRYRGVVGDQDIPWPEVLQENYPKRKAMLTADGSGLVIDTTEGSELVICYHKGDVIYRRDSDGIFIGGKNNAQPAVLGTELTSILVSLIDAILGIKVLGVTTGPGTSGGLFATSVTALNSLKTQVQGEAHLSDLTHVTKAQEE